MTTLRLFHQSYRSSGSSSNSCPMALLLLRKWRWLSRAMRSSRSFRSDAALEALAKVSEVKTPNVIVLYNYPSFSGAFSPLPHFALLFRYSLQLMEMSSVDIIASGNSCVSTRQIAANKLLDKVFKVQLGRGLNCWIKFSKFSWAEGFMESAWGLELMVMQI